VEYQDENECQEALQKLLLAKGTAGLTGFSGAADPGFEMRWAER
jgi:hypothetical protein